MSTILSKLLDSARKVIDKRNSDREMIASAAAAASNSEAVVSESTASDLGTLSSLPSAAHPTKSVATTSDAANTDALGNASSTFKAVAVVNLDGADVPSTPASKKHNIEASSPCRLNEGAKIYLNELPSSGRDAAAAAAAAAAASSHDSGDAASISRTGLSTLRKISRWEQASPDSTAVAKGRQSCPPKRASFSGAGLFI